MDPESEFVRRVSELQRLSERFRQQLKPVLLPDVTLPPLCLRDEMPRDRTESQSAGALMRRLAQTITEWRKQLPDGVQPALVALTQDGMRIQIASLAQEGFHGIRIDGTIDGVPCMLLAHQATTQILCYAEEIKPPEKPKRNIGFIIEGEQTEA